MQKTYPYGTSFQVLPDIVAMLFKVPTYYLNYDIYIFFLHNETIIETDFLILN